MPVKEICQVERASQTATPSATPGCTANGDLHYTSFDGHRFDFQGSCLYQLVGRCQERNKLVDFQVLMQNDHERHCAVSFIRAVEVEVYRVNIMVSRDYSGGILVNGMVINLPYSTDKSKISMFQRGQDAAIQTDFHLTIAFDWQSQVILTTSSTYAGTMCGLCGNFNGDKGDELTMRDGRPAPNPMAFGQSWLVAETLGCAKVDKRGFSNLAVI
ncbi:unnamed protein product [Caretta caretta]